jgi:hypothetical protein
VYSLINKFSLSLGLVEEMIDMLFSMWWDREVNAFNFNIKNIVSE